MKQLNKDQAIINDILRQGRILLDGNRLKPSDLNSDMVFMLCDNELTSDSKFADIYYNNEDEILTILSNYRG